jgi:hypothetical protein
MIAMYMDAVSFPGAQIEQYMGRATGWQANWFTEE